MNLKTLEETAPWEWPADAGDIFARALKDPQTPLSDRLIAADLAGDLIVMDDKMADLLVAVVGNAAEPEELRCHAAISLGPVLEETDTEGFDDDLSEPPIEELTFRRIKAALRRVHDDPGAPKQLRRRVLEASVRAEEDWHAGAIRAALAQGDEEWTLTAVFCMRWVRGFKSEILKALNNPKEDVQYEALLAAGNWEVEAAWPHVSKLVESRKTPKRLLLAAIEAVAGIRPREAGEVLLDLAQSKDPEIAEAVDDALMMSAPDFGEEDDEDDEYPV